MARTENKSADKVKFRFYYAAAASLGALSVALGAFGAHALRGIISEPALATFNTGTRYQMIHAVVLLVAIRFAEDTSSKWFLGAARLLLIGIVLFSGSLYGLVLLHWNFLGPVTPLGGASLIAGWVFLTIGFLKPPIHAGRESSH